MRGIKVAKSSPEGPEDGKSATDCAQVNRGEFGKFGSGLSLSLSLSQKKGVPEI